jgi:2-dehydro-3-deoxygluconokinase
VPVSFDVNYRQKLWSAEEAARTLLPLVSGVEILFCSQRDAIRLFECGGSMQAIAERMLGLSRARYVVLTLAEQGALLWDGARWLHQTAPATNTVDRLGAGDALAAGVIDGWLDADMAAGLRDGTMLAALALSQDGDMVITNRAELRALGRGNSALSR